MTSGSSDDKCRVQGCERCVVVVSRGLCNKHYMRWKTYGDPEGAPRPRDVVICKESGCESVHYGLGYCRRHWALFKKHGSNLQSDRACKTCGGFIQGGKNAKTYCSSACKPRPKQVGTPCSVSECRTRSRKLGLCQRHLTAFERFGDPEFVLPSKEEPAPKKPTLEVCEMCGADFTCGVTQKILVCSTRCRNARHWRDNRDVLRAQNQEYRRRNRDALNAKSRADRKSNPGRYAERELAWRERNRDVINTRAAKYRDENRERINASVREWGKKNLDRKLENNRKRRALQTGSGAMLVTVKDMNRLFDRVTTCSYCGGEFSDDNPVHVEHVLPLVRGGLHSKGNLTLACARCNTSKGPKTVMEWRMWKRRVGRE